MNPYLKAITAISLALIIPPLAGESYAQVKKEEIKTVVSPTPQISVTPALKPDKKKANVLEVSELYNPKKKITPSAKPVATPTKSAATPKPNPSKPNPVKTPEIKASVIPSATPSPIVVLTPTPVPSPKEERNPDEVDVFTFTYINRLEAYSGLLKMVINSDCAKSPDNCDNKENLNKISQKINSDIKLKFPLFTDISEEQIKSMLINAVTLKDRLGEQNSSKISQVEADLNSINQSIFKEKKEEIIKIALNNTSNKTNIPTEIIATPQPSPTVNPFQSGRLVFVSERDENPEIYLMAPDGSNQTRITDNKAFDTMPSFSPDGSRIVFVSDRDGNPEIYIMNVDGTNIIRLTTNSAYDYSPHWSPDGSKIVFVSNRGDSGNTSGTVNKISFKIFVMNIDGSNQLKISETSLDDDAPKWSPDGSKIVFVSKRDGNPEIYTMNSDGTNITRLTNSQNFDIMPAWSPDGSKIAFRSDRDGNPEVYTMNSSGTDLKRVTRNFSSDESPAWSPDGTKLLFVSRRDNIKDLSGDFVNEIYEMNADSSNIARLTNNGSDDYSPSWSKN